jgi:hypothetical protein
MKMRMERRVEIEFWIELEDDRLVGAELWDEGVYAFRAELMSGRWYEPLRYKHERSVILGGQSIAGYGTLRQEYALYPEGVMRTRPIAPEWVFETLREAGVDY